MKNWFLYPPLAVFGTGMLAGVLIYFPLQIKAELPQTAYLPHTSTVTTTPLPPPLKGGGEVNLLFVGDVMMARLVERMIVTNGQNFPFANLGGLLTGNDLVIGNFEGTIRPDQNIETTNVMRFDTTPDNVQILKDAGFDLLSLSNNHSNDYGADVTELTRETIAGDGLTPFGDYFDSGKYVAHETIGDLRFSFIGYNAFGETIDGVIKAIKTEKAGGNFVIVFPHWGTEYKSVASTYQNDEAYQLVDAGADLVIGGHPHVVENIEIYNGIPIVYSMGNFLFDQNWSKATQIGLAVKVTVDQSNITFHFIPVSVVNEQTSIASDEITKQVLEQIGYPEGVLTVERPSSSPF